MKFLVDLLGSPLLGALEYRTADHAFDFTPERAGDLLARAGPDGTASLALGTIQLEIGVATGLVLFAWGYAPRTTWKREALPTPLLAHGTVCLDSSMELQASTAVDLPDAYAWTTTYDSGTNWVFVGIRPEVSSVFQIATGIGLVVRDESLEGIWLQATEQP